MGYGKHELSTINMFAPPPPKKNYITPLLFHNGHLSTTATFFCPQGAVLESLNCSFPQPSS